MAKMIPLISEIRSLVENRPGRMTHFQWVARECATRRQVESDPAILGYLFAVEFVLDWVHGGRTCGPLDFLDKKRKPGLLSAILRYKQTFGWHGEVDDG